MKKKKWHTDPRYYIGFISLIILAWGINVKVVDFSRLGETTKALAGQVQETNKRVYIIEKYIDVQQEANQLQREWIKQQRQQPPPYEPPAPRGCWENGYEYDCTTLKWLN